MFDKKLKTENYSLMVENLNLASENEELKKLVERRTSDCMTLEKTVEEQKNHINEIYVKYEAIEKRNKELEENYAKLYEALTKKAKEYSESKFITRESVMEDYKKNLVNKIFEVSDVLFGLI